jgi:hypothetical protein
VTSFVTSLFPVMLASRVVDRASKKTDPTTIERGVSLPFGGSLALVARKD